MDTSKPSASTSSPTSASTGTVSSTGTAAAPEAAPAAPLDPAAEAALASVGEHDKPKKFAGFTDEQKAWIRRELELAIERYSEQTRQEVNP